MRSVGRNAPGTVFKAKELVSGNPLVKRDPIEELVQKRRRGAKKTFRSYLFVIEKDADLERIVQRTKACADQISAALGYRSQRTG